MNKCMIFSVSMALAAAPLSSAQEPAPAEAEAAPAAEGGAAQVIEAVETMNAAQMKLLGVLQSIHDTASADAAAPQVQQMTAEIDGLKKALQALKPTPEDMRQVQAHFQPKEDELRRDMATMQQTFLELSSTTPAPYYGSHTLVRALHLPEAAADAPASLSVEEAVTEADLFIGALRELTETLAAVQDAASADAAAPKVQKLMTAISAMAHEGPAFANASPAVAAELDRHFGGSTIQTMQEAGRALNCEAARIKTQQCYGSEALTKSLGGAQ